MSENGAYNGRNVTNGSESPVRLESWEIESLVQMDRTTLEVRRKYKQTG